MRPLPTEATIEAMNVSTDRCHPFHAYEKRKKRRQTKKEAGRHLGMDRSRVRQVQKGSGKQTKMVVKSSMVPKRIYGGPTTPAVEG